MTKPSAEQKIIDDAVAAAVARLERNVEALAFDLREARSRIARLEHIIATGQEPLQ